MIVTGRSNVVHDYLDPASIPPDTMLIRGQNRIVTLTATNAASDNAGSRYKLCAIPSNALMDETTAFQVQNWGYATVQVGTQANPTSLLNVAKSAAAVQTPFVFGDANHGKRLWEILGLAADPGGEIMLWATGPADATAAGTIKAKVVYRL